MLTKTAWIWYIKNPPRKTRVSAVFKSLNESSKSFWKKFKKDVDKVRNTWYDIKVAAEQEQQTAPWQINSNATLKIPKKNFREQIRFERIDPNKTVKSRNVCEANKDGKPDYSGEENNLRLLKLSTWEFDPGSGWTLAACLTHASRTDKDET